MKKNLDWYYFSITIGFFVLLCNGCHKDGTSRYNQTSTDYSQSRHWLSLPPTVYKADVFYLYPTTSWTKDNTAALICAIDDSLMMSGAASAFARQATAFDTAANVQKVKQQREILRAKPQPKK